MNSPKHIEIYKIDWIKLHFLKILDLSKIFSHTSSNNKIGGDEDGPSLFWENDDSQRGWIGLNLELVRTCRRSSCQESTRIEIKLLFNFMLHVRSIKFKSSKLYIRMHDI